MNVAVVKYISECDVKEIPSCRMPYEQALEELKRVPKKYRHQFDLVAINEDGTLGRFVSWAI